METIKQAVYDFSTGAAVQIAKFGHIPEHIAFIMDGNRRYAKERGLPSTQGHVSGKNMMDDIIEWLPLLGVKEITFYAFSIENFKRPKNEVDFLMDLTEDMIQTHRLFNIAYAKQRGIRYEFIGDCNLFPEKLKPLIARVMIGTRNNTKLKVNIAFVYTARDALERSVSAIVEGLQKGELEAGDVDESLLQNACVLHPMRKVDWLIRTSGETRLSDFMLLESKKALLSFYPESFPELSYWRILQGFQDYQRFAGKKIDKNVDRDQDAQRTEANGSREMRRNAFLNKIRENGWAFLKTV